MKSCPDARLGDLGERHEKLLDGGRRERSAPDPPPGDGASS
jgi:hypothetical protein